MEMPKSDVVWPGSEYNAAQLRLTMKIQTEEAREGNPEEYDTCWLRAWGLHLLAANP